MKLSLRYKLFLGTLALLPVGATIASCIPAGASAPAPNIIYTTDLNGNGKTVQEFVLPDGTRCVSIGYSSGVGITCDWSK